MSVSVFLSTVSDEFLAYREQLRGDLTRHNVEVKVQEDFKALGGDTLDKLDVYVAHCDAVVHLVGAMTGAAPKANVQRALLTKYPDLADKLPPLGEAIRHGVAISYTQWEAWLALYHGKLLLIAKAEEAAPRGPKHAPTPQSQALQDGHLARLRQASRYPECVFANADELAKQIAYTAILDLLVKQYAQHEAAERAVAEGFIGEMAKRVAGDKALDLDGMKQAVRNAIEIYEKELAGGQDQTNLDAIVDEALRKAKALVDQGKSALARAALRKTAQAMRRDEDERRERYGLSMTALYSRERDIALANYDGEAAAEAMIALAEDIHPAQAAGVREMLDAESRTLLDFGEVRGSNVHLVAAIALRRKGLALAETGDHRGAAHHNLGHALQTLGARESGTARLEAAVAACRAALEEWTRDRAPLDWARTQNNLGNALWTLGARESGTVRLEAAVAAYRAALEEWTRERAPLDWATTQNNLGNALSTLGERESGTARLEAAVAAYRAALEERTRERAPLDWAMTQNNLGNALQTLGARESGTARLEAAVAAYRAALEEWTRERAPLDWAMTQNNLGNALSSLGARESGTARLEEAVAAYRAALEELTRERAPLDWATTQNNLGAALYSLGERESGTTRLEEAVAAYRAALEERTRERVPLDWASSQYNLANALALLAQRRADPGQMAEALQAMRNAVEVYREVGESYWLPIAETRVGEIEAALSELKSTTATPSPSP